MFKGGIRAIGAVVIYEKYTLKIHDSLLLRCHHTVRTLFVIHMQSARGNMKRKAISMEEQRMNELYVAEGEKKKIKAGLQVIFFTIPCREPSSLNTNNVSLAARFCHYISPL